LRKNLPGSAQTAGCCHGTDDYRRFGFIDILNNKEDRFPERVPQDGIHPGKRTEYLVEYFEFNLLFFY
jgi:hypothetical protein